MSRTIYGIFWERYVYVGQTDGDPYRRWKQHRTELDMRRHSCRGLQQIYMLEPENVRFEVLERDASDTAEAEWIRYYGVYSLNTAKNPHRPVERRRTGTEPFRFMGRTYVSYAEAARDTGKSVSYVRRITKE